MLEHKFRAVQLFSPSMIWWWDQYPSPRMCCVCAGAPGCIYVHTPLYCRRVSFPAHTHSTAGIYECCWINVLPDMYVCATAKLLGALWRIDFMCRLTTAGGAWPLQVSPHYCPITADKSEPGDGRVSSRPQSAPWQPCARDAPARPPARGWFARWPIFGSNPAHSARTHYERGQSDQIAYTPGTCSRLVQNGFVQFDCLLCLHWWMNMQTKVQQSTGLFFFKLVCWRNF